MNGGTKHEAVAARDFFKEQVHAVIPEALARFPAFPAGDAPGYRMLPIQKISVSTPQPSSAPATSFSAV